MANHSVENIKPPRLDYDDWDEIFLQIGSERSASELHGVLIGSLSVGYSLTPVQWLQQVVEYLGAEILEEEFRDQRQALEKAQREWQLYCKSDPTQLFLLLPADDEKLPRRLEAIGEWCTGFIEGVSLGMREHPQELSEDVRELLTDIMAIAEIDPDATESEEQEHDYMELIEFVRIAAMNLMVEFNPVQPPPGTSLH